MKITAINAETGRSETRDMTPQEEAAFVAGQNAAATPPTTVNAPTIFTMKDTVTGENVDFKVENGQFVKIQGA